MAGLCGGGGLEVGCCTGEAVVDTGEGVDVTGEGVVATGEGVVATGDAEGKLVVDNPPPQAQHACY